MTYINTTEPYGTDSYTPCDVQYLIDDGSNECFVENTHTNEG